MPKRLNLCQQFTIAGLCLCSSMMGGCSTWNAWLDLWRFGSHDKAAIAVPGVSQEVTDKDAAKLPALVVYRITLPAGTFTANTNVWPLLDENSLEATTSTLMVHNGFRAGVGQLKDWQSVYKLINVPGAATEQTVCQTVGRAAFGLTTHANVANEVVVSVDKEVEQQGRTFAQCDNGFRLNFTTLRPNGTPARNLTKKDKYGELRVLVELEPVVAEGVVNVVRKNPDLGVTRQEVNATSNFTDLQFSATIRTDQFLVVTPLDVKENKFSVGTQWLSDPSKIPATETILVFVPTPPDSPAITGK